MLSGWNASGMKVWKPRVSSCKLAQLQQVIHAVLRGLDVAVEHGAVGVQAHLVRGAGHLEPLLAGQLVIADDAPHALVRRSPRRRRACESRPASFRRSSTSRGVIFAALREVTDLDHGEGLQMHLREALLQAAQHLAIPLERQFRMQAAHDVEFGNGFASSPRPRFPRPLRATWCRPWDRLAFLPNAHSLQLATHTSVGLMCRLTLK